jgi:hypothetical protein|tara:strand:- start:98 stop:364 length:267 start_codon:yes stop_codon:yes gene_type:complete
MFIGSIYTLNNPELTDLGYTRIEIKDRVLSRTEERVRFIDPGQASVAVTAYYYTLLCLADRRDTAEIDEELFQSEVISGYYDLTGWGE